jgi:hypothetical protein
MRTQTDSGYYIHRECTQGPTWKSTGGRWRRVGPKRVRPNCGFGRTDLVSAHLGLPRGASLLVPKPF